MKKIIIPIIFVLLVALLIFLVLGFSMKNNASVGIIGGADGPTAIFVSGSVLGALIPLVAVILLATVILGIAFHKKK